MQSKEELTKELATQKKSCEYNCHGISLGILTGEMPNENDDPTGTAIGKTTSGAKISALDKERAKVEVISSQLKAVQNDKHKLQTELDRTRQQLEIQMKQSLQLRKQLQQKNTALSERIASDINPNDDRVKDLEAMLKNCQSQLSDQLEQAQKRESKLHKVVEQSAQYEKELQQLKQDQVHQKGNDLAVKRLERQRNELLHLVQKQMSLIGILKQQALHAKAATLLDIAEKEFMKELNLKH